MKKPRKNHTHNPQTAHLTTCQNAETNNNKFWLTNFGVKKNENTEKTRGEKAQTLEIIYKQNANEETKKQPHTQPPNRSFNHLPKCRKNNNKNMFH